MQDTDYGTVTYEGIEYALTEDAFVVLDMTYGHRTVYRAHALGPDGRTYRVQWPVRPGFDRYADDYVGDEDAPDDESVMCDWDAPESVRLVG